MDDYIRDVGSHCPLFKLPVYGTNASGIKIHKSIYHLYFTNTLEKYKTNFLCFNYENKN